MAANPRVCLRCGAPLADGPASWDGDAGRPVHAACESRRLVASAAARAAALKGWHGKRLRRVALALKLRVCEGGTYLDDTRVLRDVAFSPIDDARFRAAVALVTGAGAPPPSPPAPRTTAELTDELKRELSTLQADLAERLEGLTDELAERVAAARRELVVTVGERTTAIEGLTHPQFPKLVRMLAAGLNVWVAGPAGSGKTTAVEQAARALGLKFYFNGAIDSEYKLSGFVDAHGRIVSTPFRRAYEGGGVYLFDEVDASLPSAVLAFNAALANGAADFPGCDEPVKRHPDFRCVAAGNTWGAGATSEYVGRMKLDAAFVDRFVQLAWSYDDRFEAAMVPDNPAWVARVQELRAAAARRGLKVVISPRASINGARLIAAGMTEDEALDAVLRAKISEADWNNLSSSVRS